MFKCLECGRDFTNMNSLSRHISTHMTQEQYFNKYLRKSEQDGKCVICGKPTRFRNFAYSICCSQSCRNTWINQNRSEEERKNLSKKISNTHKTKETKEKTKQTNINKYGVPYTTQNNRVQEKRKQTCIDKYGVDCSFKADIVKQKIQDSIHEHFGKEGLKSKKVREKTIATCLEKYGTINGGASQQAQEKIRQTNLKHYGVESSFQAAEVKNKIKQTCQAKYGVDYASQADVVKEKIVQTNLAKYNVKCQYQRPDLRQKLALPEVIEKKYKTKRINKTFNASGPEDRCYEILLKLFPNVQRSYKSKEYPYLCDFYVSELDLYIECHFFWTHGGHFFDSTNPNDIAVVEYWESRHTKFYDNAIYNWTVRDVEKLKCATNNKLNYLVCWTEEEFFAIFSRDFSCDRDYPEFTNKNISMIAKIACWNEYFKREIEYLQNPEVLGKLFINRYKYLHKLPYQLDNLTLLNGVSISGLLRKYSTFDNTGMLEFIEKYKPTTIYDPCAGWGERLLTCYIHNIKYFGIDINPAVIETHQKLIDLYKIQNCTSILGDSAKFNSDFDCMFTCPPYWNTEIYSDSGAENFDYTNFLQWWKQVVQNSNCKIVAYQINQKFKTDMNQQILDLGYDFIDEIILPQRSSHFTRRNGNQKTEYESIQVFNKNF